MTVEAEKFILVVDDDEDNLELIRMRLQVEGYNVKIAQNGEIAWEIARDNIGNIETILLDRCMPGMDGITLLHKIKSDEHFKHIPVIIESALTEKKEIIEGIEAGAYYYLTKPFSKEVLLSIVNAAVKDARDAVQLRSELQGNIYCIQNIKQCHLEFNRFSEVHNIAVFLSNLFPEPGRVAMGVQEIVRNSIEHGNLAISYDQKTELIKQNRLFSEIDRRQGLPEYKDKKVSIKFEHKLNEWRLRITDEGNGFDWTQYMEVSPDRVTDNHGRGIAMANLCCFDDVTYLGRGNDVICTVWETNKFAPSKES